MPQPAAAEPIRCGAPAARAVRIAPVASREQGQAVSNLVGRRYAWRGYQCAPQSVPSPDEGLTLHASDDEGTVGTITVGIDGAKGLKAESIFGEEIEALRRSGRRLCEFTRLAIDSERGGEQVLASLFHAAYLFAHRQRQCDMVVLEVNPRHVRYYERSLGARQLAGPRLNPRVDAPAVLLGIEFEHITRQLCGTAAASAGRSLYARALPPDQQEAVLHHLQHLNLSPLVSAAA